MVPKSDLRVFYYELWRLLVVLDNSTMNNDDHTWCEAAYYK